MSTEPTRYSLVMGYDREGFPESDMEPNPDGKWYHHSDFDALKAENMRMRAALHAITFFSDLSVSEAARDLARKALANPGETP